MNHDQQTAFEKIAGEFVRVPVVEPDVYREPDEAPSSFANLTEVQRMKFVELQRRIMELEKQPRIERRLIEAQLIERLLKAGTAEKKSRVALCIYRAVLVEAYRMELIPERTWDELGKRLDLSEGRTRRLANEIEAKSGAQVVASYPGELP